MFDWVQSPLHPMTRCIKPPPFHPTNTIVNANHFRHCALTAGRMANTARALCDCSQPHTADGHSFSRSVVVDLSRRVCLPLVRRVARTPHTHTHPQQISILKHILPYTQKPLHRSKVPPPITLPHLVLRVLAFSSVCANRVRVFQRKNDGSLCEEHGLQKRSTRPILTTKLRNLLKPRNLHTNHRLRYQLQIVVDCC